MKGLMVFQENFITIEYEANVKSKIRHYKKEQKNEQATRLRPANTDLLIKITFRLRYYYTRQIGKSQ